MPTPLSPFDASIPSLRPLPLQRQLQSEVPSYEYIGCFSDQADEDRALEKGFLSPEMTHEVRFCILYFCIILFLYLAYDLSKLRIRGFNFYAFGRTYEFSRFTQAHDP